VRAQLKKTGALVLALTIGVTPPVIPVVHAQSVEPASTRPNDLIAKVDVEQHLGDPLPLYAPFTDENGKDVVLGSYFGKKPVVLALVYYECPMLCTLVLNGLVSAAKPLDLQPERDFDVVVVSFDPTETPDLALAKKATYMDAYGRPGTENGWHFLTGKREQIEMLTGALGFRYAYDPKSGEYAHAAAIYVATPEGKISRYLFGVDYSSRDLKLSLVEATGGTIGTLADKLLLLCYHYDPDTGTYTRAALGVMRVAGLVTVAAIVLLILTMRRRERAQGEIR